MLRLAAFLITALCWWDVLGPREGYRQPFVMLGTIAVTVLLLAAEVRRAQNRRTPVGAVRRW